MMKINKNISRVAMLCTVLISLSIIAIPVSFAADYQIGTKDKLKIHNTNSDVTISQLKWSSSTGDQITLKEGESATLSFVATGYVDFSNQHFTVLLDSGLYIKSYKESGKITSTYNNNTLSATIRFDGDNSYNEGIITMIIEPSQTSEHKETYGIEINGADYKEVKVQLKKKTVTFNPGDGRIDGSKSKITKSFYDRAKPLSSIKPPNPEKNGYKFNGWYTAASGGTKVSSNSASSNYSIIRNTTDISETSTLHAQYTKEPTEKKNDSTSNSTKKSGADNNKNSYSETPNSSNNTYTETTVAAATTDEIHYEEASDPEPLTVDRNLESIKNEDTPKTSTIPTALQILLAAGIAGAIILGIFKVAAYVKNAKSPDVDITTYYKLPGNKKLTIRSLGTSKKVLVTGDNQKIKDLITLATKMQDGKERMLVIIRHTDDIQSIVNHAKNIDLNIYIVVDINVFSIADQDFITSTMDKKRKVDVRILKNFG